MIIAHPWGTNPMVPAPKYITPKIGDAAVALSKFSMNVKKVFLVNTVVCKNWSVRTHKSSSSGAWATLREDHGSVSWGFWAGGTLVCWSAMEMSESIVGWSL